MNLADSRDAALRALSPLECASRLDRLRAVWGRPAAAPSIRVREGAPEPMNLESWKAGPRLARRSARRNFERGTAQTGAGAIRAAPQARRIARATAVTAELFLRGS
jgi:hypothetical protein